jgi:hypothetical protein
MPTFANKYRVSGPIDLYVGSPTPIGAIGTTYSTTPVSGTYRYNSTNWSGAATKLQHHTYSTDNTYCILSTVVAHNCLMLIKGWRLKKKIEINAQHHMFKARPFD